MVDSNAPDELPGAGDLVGDDVGRTIAQLFDAEPAAAAFQAALAEQLGREFQSLYGTTLNGGASRESLAPVGDAGNGGDPRLLPLSNGTTSSACPQARAPANAQQAAARQRRFWYKWAAVAACLVVGAL